MSSRSRIKQPGKLYIREDDVVELVFSRRVDAVLRGEREGPDIWGSSVQ